VILIDIVDLNKEFVNGIKDDTFLNIAEHVDNTVLKYIILFCL